MLNSCDSVHSVQSEENTGFIISINAAIIDSVYPLKDTSPFVLQANPDIRKSKPLEWTIIPDLYFPARFKTNSATTSYLDTSLYAHSAEKRKAIIIPKYALYPDVEEVKYYYVKDYNPGNFASIRVQEGLRHNQIRAITQDKSGNLWIASDDGLTKYDGKFLYHYTTDHGLSNNLILNVFQDSQENLWIGTFRGGAIKYDGSTFTTFKTEHGIADNVVNAITEDSNGNIWFATGNGISCFDGIYFTNYRETEGLGANDTRDIITDKNNNIIVATYGGGISYFNGNKFITYNTTNGMQGDYVISLAFNKQQKLLIGTSNEGFSIFDGHNFTHFSEKTSFPDNNVRYIYADSKDNIWIATASTGIIKMSDGKLTVFDTQSGLPSNYIRSIYEDKDGTLWLGTRGGGVSRYNGHLFAHYTTNDGLSGSRVMNIFSNQEETWFGTYGNYVTLLKRTVINGQTRYFLSYFNDDHGLYGSRIYKIFQDSNNNIWFGTDGGGITKFDSKRTYTYTTSHGLASNAIRDIEEDIHGNLWVATYGKGISIFNGSGFKTLNTFSGLPSNNIMTIFKDSENTMWIGTDGGGLLNIKDSTFTLYSPKNGFPATSVYAITEDNQGNLWFGTAGNGLLGFDGTSFIKYDTQSGLNSNYILSLHTDPSGDLWIGTRSGLNSINNDQLELLYNNQDYIPSFKSYYYEDGFSGISCNLGALSHDNNGKIWVGTETMLTSLNPSTTNDLKYSTEPIITDFKLHYTRIPWHLFRNNPDTTILLRNGLSINNIQFDSISKWYNLPVNLKLNHNNNYVSFNYSSISYYQNNRILFQYKLEGVDKHWANPTYRTEASYGNLNPGKYIFKVRSVNSSGEQGKEVSFSFSIKPPWYKTAFFYILAVFLSISLIILFIHKRTEKITFEKLRLERIISEKTTELKERNIQLENSNLEKDKFFSIISHDLKGPFNGFLGLTQILSESIEQLTSTEVKEIASNLRTSASNLYTLLENLLQWSSLQRSSMPFNPEPLPITDIINNNISALLADASTKKIQLLNNTKKEHTVIADKNMFLTVIRNLISNAIKFTSDNGTITITSHQSNNLIQISVKDTGIGMNQEIIENLFKLNMVSKRVGTKGEPSSGIGLVISKEFIEKNGGKLWVESEENKGSIFHFTLPSN